VECLKQQLNLLGHLYLLESGFRLTTSPNSSTELEHIGTINLRNFPWKRTNMQQSSVKTGCSVALPNTAAAVRHPNLVFYGLTLLT